MRVAVICRVQINFDQSLSAPLLGLAGSAQAPCADVTCSAMETQRADTPSKLFTSPGGSQSVL